MAKKEKKLSVDFKFFNALINSGEKENKELSKYLHGNILQEIIVLKNNIHAHIKDLQENKFNPGEFDKDLEIIDKFYTDLRTIMQGLYPTLLESFGLIKTLMGYSRELSAKSLNINVKNDSTIEKFPFSFEKKLNIFRTYVLIINYLLKVSEQNKVTIFINDIENQLYIEFVCGSANRENSADIDHLSSADFKEIQARLLLLEAIVGQNSDWLNFVQIIIPF